MNHFRSLSRRPIVAAILALTTVGVSVTVPLLDVHSAELGAQTISDAGSPGSPFSHDHLLCILFQSSPGLATSHAMPVLGPCVADGTTSWVFVEWKPSRQTEKPTARAPPPRS